MVGEMWPRIRIAEALLLAEPAVLGRSSGSGREGRRSEASLREGPDIYLQGDQLSLLTVLLSCRLCLSKAQVRLHPVALQR